MKVVAKGREQAGWALEVECTGRGVLGGGCHAKLLVTESDLYRSKSSVVISSARFTCVECGIVSQTFLEKAMWERLPWEEHALMRERILTSHSASVTGWMPKPLSENSHLPIKRGEMVVIMYDDKGVPIMWYNLDGETTKQFTSGQQDLCFRVLTATTI